MNHTNSRFKILRIHLLSELVSCFFSAIIFATSSIVSTASSAFLAFASVSSFRCWNLLFGSRLPKFVIVDPFLLPLELDLREPFLDRQTSLNAGLYSFRTSSSGIAWNSNFRGADCFCSYNFHTMAVTFIQNKIELKNHHRLR